jgi:hypothetical protein
MYFKYVQPGVGRHEKVSRMFLVRNVLREARRYQNVTAASVCQELPRTSVREKYKNGSTYINSKESR